MSYFQNPFDEFRGVWILGDRQYSLDFNIPSNTNKSNYQLSWNTDPYDFSASGVLTLNYAFDVCYKYYGSLSIDCTGSIPSATTAFEVVAALNANPTFAEYFVAQIYTDKLRQAAGPWQVMITKQAGRVKQDVRLYISNGGAESEMGFNVKAPVAELPLYFNRHTIANRLNFPDSAAQLVLLSHHISSITVANPTTITATAHGLSNGDMVYIGASNSTPSVDGSYVATVVDANTFTVPVNVTVAGDTGEALSVTENAVVTAAGFNISAAKTDWQLLSGRSGIFNFQKITVDGSNRITRIIEYPAGATAGYLARKIQYVYSGANTSPSQITEIPYTLTASDLITPP